MKKQTSLITLSLMLATPALAGGAGAPVARPSTPATCRSIAQIITTDPQFSTLLTAVQAAGLSQTLMGGQYTVFAPTNAAFAKVPSDTLAQVLNDPDMLGSVLLYHVVPGKVTSSQVKSLQNVKTAQGANLAVRMSGNRVMINNANVTRTDIQACNGVIHVVDAVLMPPTMAGTAPAMPAAPAPVTAAPAAPAAPMAPAATDVTRIPALPLSGATMNTGMTSTATTTTTGTATDTTAATTTDTSATTDTTTTTTTTTDTTATATTDTSTATTDMSTATTGTATDTTAATTTETAAEANTLYDVIADDDRFSTLRGLLSDAGLTEMLMSGEYTIFAPTNEAFDALPADTLATLEANPDVLKQVLSYHVVQGRVTAEQLGSGTALNAVEGGALPVSMNGSTQMIGTATVGDPITTASNGTIYVINQVLMPPGLTLPAPTTVEAAPATTAADTSGTATTATTATTTTTTTTAAPTTTTPATTATPAAGTATTGTTGTTTTTTTTTATAPTTGSSTSTTPTSGDNTTLASLIATNPRFTTLAQLVQQAGLADTLATGEYTLFAPTNDAFAKVAPADLTALSADPARLKDLLLYHVVSGRITGTALASSPQLNSVQGGALTLTRSASPERTMIGTAIIAPGSAIDTGNGTLYEIDTVLMPPAR
ncbi:beta-Ig-H3/fasciclin [Deinococcus phoenicis]|uniref:Beta-Ig-H3/fasciclin n=1 Tax=Deinococcus phoenicis TaxID=1476583 RepID=A0A016QUB6_9DEIO|nr:fasciclin domain-containing protein [Deinococcus phoenicis]EYB69720.1 beta-Ig-H3/fasciclin [Deinococcus phoenicis]